MYCKRVSKPVGEGPKARGRCKNNDIRTSAGIIRSSLCSGALFSIPSRCFVARTAINFSKRMILPTRGGAATTNKWRNARQMPMGTIVGKRLTMPFLKKEKKKREKMISCTATRLRIMHAFNKNKTCKEVEYRYRKYPHNLLHVYVLIQVLWDGE